MEFPGECMPGFYRPAIRKTILMSLDRNESGREIDPTGLSVGVCPLQSGGKPASDGQLTLMMASFRGKVAVSRLTVPPACWPTSSFPIGDWGVIT